MNDGMPDIESHLRELVFGGQARRAELNEFLRTTEAARPVVARLLIEDAALISVLRQESVEKWACTLQPRVIPLPAAPARGGRRLAAILLALAACVTLGKLVLFDSPETPHPATPPLARSWIGVVTPLDGTARTSLIEKGEFELAAGRVRIDLDNGVVLSVTGPARLTVGLDECRLRMGQVGVDVPKDLDTYVVETESGRFVDLGTAFSVSVQPGKRTEMAVQEGLVRAERFSYEGDVVSKQLVRKEEGVIFESTAPRIQTVKAGDLGHEAPIPLAEASLAIPQAYRDAVAASSPMITWDFESRLDDTTFTNRSRTGFPAKIHGQIGVRHDDSGNQFIVLGESEGWIESPEPWRKRDSDPFTIELWARPDRIHWGHLFNLRVEEATDRVTAHTPLGPLSFFAMEFTHTREFLPLPPEPSIRCTFRSPATEHPTLTTRGGLNVDLVSPQRYLPGKWHHLVARVDGSGFTLFIDGEPAVRRAVKPPDFGMVSLGLRVGALRHRSGSHRQFAGALDEVAIYDHALSDADVSAHFRAMGMAR